MTDMNDDSRTMDDLAGEIRHIASEAGEMVEVRLTCRNDDPAWKLEIVMGAEGLMRTYGVTAHELIARAAAYISDYQPALEREANR